MTWLRSRPDVVAFVVLAVTIRIAFWSFTGRVWEDGLITLASPRNAVDGLGLTHHAGEPLTHAFTSALSVLIPLVGEVVATGSGLLAIRLASLVAVAVAIVAADGLGRHLGLGRPARALVMGYLALDLLHIFFGMTGMETQVAVAILLVALWAMAIRHPLLGVAVGLGILARPDFVILAGAVGLPLLLRDRPQLTRTIAGASLVVVPWVAFTTIYYGSPIPQSIVAKSIAFTTFPSDTSLMGWTVWLPGQVLAHVPSLGRTFAPFLEDSMAFSAPLPVPSLMIIGFAGLMLSWLGIVLRRDEPAWQPLITFVIAYTAYRVLFLPTIYFDWYLPPYTAVSAFLIATALQEIAQGRERRLAGVVIGCLALVAVPLPWSFAMERAIQVEVEDAVRVEVSRALGEMVGTGEGVVSESAGYIGWHSRVMLWDFPGLTSKTSSASLQATPPGERSLATLIDRLRPPWAVLRPFELAEFRETYPETAARYEEVARFGEERYAIERFGYSKYTVDAGFVIVRLRPSP